jgi:hypothetical protein
VHIDHIAIGLGNDVAHVRHGGDHRHVELALQPLLDDLHVQQAEETAAETEAQRRAAFGCPRQAGIVQLQLLHGIAQLFVLVGIHREDARPHHGLHILEAVMASSHGRSLCVMVSPTFTSLAVLMPLMM